MVPRATLRPPTSSDEPSKPPGSGIRYAARLWVRAVRRCTTEAIDQLHRRERTKAAVLRLGGAARRIHLEMGTRLVERGGGSTFRPTSSSSPWPSSTMRWSAVRHPRPASYERGTVTYATTRRTRRCRRLSWCPSPAAHRIASDRSPRGVGGGTRSLHRSRSVSSAIRAALSRKARCSSQRRPTLRGHRLFACAGAIVLERGGPLSHAAILARELGVPAVSNVPHATTHLEGHVVRVDGDAGVVAIVDHPADTTDLVGSDGGATP